MNKIFLIIVSILLIVAIVKYFVSTSLKSLRRYFHLKKHGVLHNAKVVDYIEEKDNDGVTFYFPLVEFTSQDGRLIEGKLSIGKPKYELQGKNILIYSDPKKPEDIIEKNQEPIILGLVALVISVLVCCLILNYLYIQIVELL